MPVYDKDRNINQLRVIVSLLLVPKDHMDLAAKPCVKERHVTGASVRRNVNRGAKDQSTTFERLMVEISHDFLHF